MLPVENVMMVVVVVMSEMVMALVYFLRCLLSMTQRNFVSNSPTHGLIELDR